MHLLQHILHSALYTDVLQLYRLTAYGYTCVYTTFYMHSHCAGKLESPVKL